MVAIDVLLEFIAASPSPYHAVQTAAGRLAEAGFREVRLTDAWEHPGACYVRAGGALVAWADHGGGAVERPFRIVGAHTDSPNLRVKPHPDRSRAGFRQVAVEVYGGALLNSWLDRDLGLSGRVSVAADGGPGGTVERLVLVDEPIARVPQLAIHLDRDANKGLRLDPQEHLWPVWGLDDGTGFVDLLAERLGVAPGAIRSWDLMFHDLTAPTLLGADRSLVAAPRLDNQLSCWAGLEALVAVGRSSAPPPSVPVLCLFDHEEVGSASTTGAAGPLLEHVLERIVLARGGTRADLLRALPASVCLSADGAHATHPNHPERHEPNHRVAIDGGPVVKVNGNQRYATDAATAAVAVEACERAGVPHQRFVTRNDLPCGSTIGPLTATRLGIPTVDVGVAQLSMHSARELCGAEDPVRFVGALGAFLAG